MADYKSQIVTSKVETDDLTFAKVSADQVCKTPLIPNKSPSKQLRWAVTIEKGAVYNPEKRTGIFGDVVRVGYSARINSSIYARKDLELECGIGSKGCGMVLGSVVSNGDLKIIEPVARSSDYAPGSVIINGPVIGRRVSIQGQAIVRGPVIGYEQVNINGRVQVHGLVHSVRGGVQANGLFCHAIIAGNEPPKQGKGATDKPPGIKLWNGITLLMPMIWLKRGEGGIKMTTPVRVLSSTCMNCPPGNILMCSFAGTKACLRKDKVRMLTLADAINYEGGLLINDSWRARSYDSGLVKSVVEKDYEYLKSAKDFRALWNAFKEDDLQGYATIEDLATKVTQVTQEITNITQETIMGDKIGTKVDVRDSVLVRSNISGGPEKDSDDGDRSGTSKLASIKDSIALRSNIAADGPDRVSKGSGQKSFQPSTKCPKCGKQLMSSATICPYCLTELK